MPDSQAVRRTYVWALACASVGWLLTCAFPLPPVACPDGYADCLGDDGVCESLVVADPNHCGRCGRSCLGGACNLGECAAVQVVSGQGNVGGIAVDDQYLYWTDSVRGLIQRAYKDGGNPELLASGQSSPISLALRAGRLAWGNTNVDSVGAVDVDGDGGLTLAAGPRLISWGYVAIDEGHVYWTNQDGGLIERSPRHAAAPEPLFVGEAAPQSVLIDGDDLYWTTGGGELYRATKSGGGRTRLAGPFAALTHLTADPQYVYVTQGGNDGGVVRVDKERGAFVVLSANDRSPHGTMADGDFVYFATDDGLFRVPKQGGPKERYEPANNVHRLAADDLAIYWSRYSGLIFRRVK